MGGADALRDFTSGNAARQILLFSLPMLIGNIFQQMYSMVDAVVVGRFVGGSALAAVGVAMNLLQFLLSMLIGLTTGASVVISQLYGARQYEKLNRTVATSIVSLAVFSVTIAALGIALSPALLSLLNTSPEILGDAVLYMRILMGGVVFPVFYNMYTAYLRALGDSRGPLFILICCTIVNTVLDLLFVIRFQWGVLGVAVATVMAQALSVALCYAYVRRGASLLRIAKLTFDRGLFRTILRYGTPAALQLSLVSLAHLSITRLVNSFGAAAMAGITAAGKIDQMAIMPVSTISLALSTFVAQNMGAEKEDRARQGFRSSLIYMVVIAVCISAILIMFGSRLVSQFLNQDDENAGVILAVGLKYLNIMVVFYFLFAFLFAFNGFFRGAGDAVIAMVFPVSSLTIRAIFAHLLINLAGMGPEALAWSIPIGWGLCSLASFIYYRKRLWVGKIVARPG